MMMPNLTTRRTFLRTAGGGFGGLALAAMLASDGQAGTNHPAKAKA